MVLRTMAFLLTVGVAVGAPTREPAERLGRGVFAQRLDDQRVLVSWRLLPGESADAEYAIHLGSTAFSAAPFDPQECAIVKGAYQWIDEKAPAAEPRTYFVGRYERQAGWYPGAGPVGVTHRDPAGSPWIGWTVPAGAPAGYTRIPLRTPPDYHPNDAAVGDLDGDSQLEIVLKQELRGYDNSQAGVCPGTTRLQAYRLSGEFLWEVDLGPNIRTGAHYTPFIVFDLDGDGRAEVAVRTAEGTKDGTGQVIGDTDGDGRTDYVNPKTGYVLEGPEFLSVYDGQTGAERARVPYIARGKVSDWGDNYGNRVDRFLMAVAYLDGRSPSIVMCRGYYALTKLEAWDLGDFGLQRRWAFTSADPGHEAYAGQGNHNLSVGDVDGDGRDEIIYGACAVDDDGRGLYSTGLGHGDAIHLSDLDPDRPGLELFTIHEHKPCPAGWEMRDPATGKLLWGLPTERDTGRGMAADIDPRHRGYEVWAGGGPSGLYSAQGRRIGDARPGSTNMAIWWDGDLLGELLDGTTILKWDHLAGAVKTLLDTKPLGCASNNGTKANPCIYGDFVGDWREEVIWRSADNQELRLYATTEPTTTRLTTLLADPVYRLSLAHQNVGYNQPNHVGYYLGEK